MFVDIHGEYQDGAERVVRNFRVVSYPTARGCAAAYYPEANVLVPLNHTAEGSNTPVSKAVIVRLEPSEDQTPDGAAVHPARGRAARLARLHGTCSPVRDTGQNANMSSPARRQGMSPGRSGSTGHAQS